MYETVLLEELARLRQYLLHLEDLFSQESKILEDCTSAYLHEAYIYILCCYKELVSFTIAFSWKIKLILSLNNLHLIQWFNSIKMSFINFWIQKSCFFSIICFESCDLWFQHSFSVSHMWTRKKDTLYEKSSFKIFMNQKVIV